VKVWFAAACTESAVRSAALPHMWGINKDISANKKKSNKKIMEPQKRNFAVFGLL
jgi:hypothetical protein